MTQVTVKNGNLDMALRKFKQKVARDGVPYQKITTKNIKNKVNNELFYSNGHNLSSCTLLMAEPTPIPAFLEIFFDCWED